METLTVKINLSNWELIPFEGKSTNSGRHRIYFFLCFELDIWFKVKPISIKQEDIY